MASSIHVCIHIIAVISPSTHSQSHTPWYRPQITVPVVHTTLAIFPGNYVSFSHSHTSYCVTRLAAIGLVLPWCQEGYSQSTADGRLCSPQAGGSGQHRASGLYRRQAASAWPRLPLLQLHAKSRGDNPPDKQRLDPRMLSLSVAFTVPNQNKQHATSLALPKQQHSHADGKQHMHAAIKGVQYHGLPRHKPTEHIEGRRIAG